MSNNISSPRHEDGLIPTVQHSGLEVYTDKKPVYVHSSQELSYPSGQEHDRAPSQEPLQAQYIAPQEPRRRSWLIPAFIAALVTALITGGAIGGGLGSSLSNCKNDLEYVDSAHRERLDCSKTMIDTFLLGLQRLEPPRMSPVQHRAQLPPQPQQPPRVSYLPTTFLNQVTKCPHYETIAPSS